RSAGRRTHRTIDSGQAVPTGCSEVRLIALSPVARKIRPLAPTFCPARRCAWSPATTLIRSKLRRPSGCAVALAIAAGVDVSSLVTTGSLAFVSFQPLSLVGARQHTRCTRLKFDTPSGVPPCLTIVIDSSAGSSRLSSSLPAGAPLTDSTKEGVGEV